MNLVALASLPFVLGGIGVFLVRRTLQTHEERVLVALRRVQEALEKRHALAQDIIAGSSQPDGKETRALQDVLKQAEFVSGLAMKGRVENQLTQELTRTVALGGNEHFWKAASALTEACDAIRSATVDYNNVVAGYHAQTAKFRQIASWLPCDTFETLVLDL